MKGRGSALRLTFAARLFLLMLGLVLVDTAPAHAQGPPQLTAPVNDFAGVIDAGDEARLDTLIRALQQASGDVIVVATVKTYQPAADLPSYAVTMFANGGRGIGQKGKDNGLLIVLAVDDRQVRAEVGYDLEGIITDGFAGAISRDTMAPIFRQGNYGAGILAGATRFAQRIAEARGVTLDGVPAQQPARRVQRQTNFPYVLLLFAAIALFNMLRGGGRRGRRRGNRWASSVGPFGAGYGGWSSGGGSWGGGSWGGGGGFGGGFGGFGGGRSGGGGGGASW